MLIFMGFFCPCSPHTINYTQYLRRHKNEIAQQDAASAKK